MIAVYHATKPTFGFGPAPVWPDAYTHVANVELNDEDHARVFELTNHIDHAWQENSLCYPVGDARERARSTSVGDVIVLSDGTALRCASFGWEAVA